MEEAATHFDEVRSGADFSSADPGEVEEARSALGATPGARTASSPKEGRMQITVLVGESGQVLDASGPAAAAAATKPLRLPPIEWPGHQLRSVRSAELIKDGTNWKLVQAFVAKPAAEVEP
jgi:hypothetical protein